MSNDRKAHRVLSRLVVSGSPMAAMLVLNAPVVSREFMPSKATRQFRDTSIATIGIPQCCCNLLTYPVYDECIADNEQIEFTDQLAFLGSVVRMEPVIPAALSN